MLMTIFILYFIFVAVVGVFISFLLIKQDLEIRRQKAIIDENASRSQNNTKELEKFYVEKKQLQADMDNEIAAIEAKLEDERNVAAMAVKSSEMLKVQLKEQNENSLQLQTHLKEQQEDYLRLKAQSRQQQEDLLKLKTEIQKLDEQLQHANETRLIEVRNESQKWAEILQSKESTLQKLGSETSSMESVMDSLALISKEMNRRLEDYSSKVKLLDEKAQENLELMAQLEH